MDWIRITFLCQELGCLPNPGALFQQNSLHIKKMTAVIRAKDEWEANEIKSGAEH